MEYFQLFCFVTFWYSAALFGVHFLAALFGLVLSSRQLYLEILLGWNIQNYLK